MLKRIRITHRLLKQTQNQFAIKKFILPDLGEKIKEATVKKWHVKVGDVVVEFDDIADVTTDKLFTQIPSPYEGIIHKLNIGEDENCDVGDVLFEIDVEGEEEDIPLANTKKVKKEPEKSQARQNVQKTDIKTLPKTEETEETHFEGERGGRFQGLINDNVLASPAVRYFAKNNNVILENVQPSGQRGRVLKEDIQNYLLKQQALKLEKTTVKVPSTHISKPELTEQVKFSSYEKGMFKAMTYSTTVPHFNLHEEYSISQLNDIRLQYNEAEGSRISIFAFVVKCFSLALQENPKMNSTYFPEETPYEYTMNHTHNISIAVDSPMGLAAPNIKKVENMSIKEIDEQIKAVAKISKEGKLTAEILSGGTVSLSNIGAISGYFATPLNLPNQCCIVALGTNKIAPKWDEESEKFIKDLILPVSFGCDHRVLNGADVARFSISWRKYIENPSLLFSKLR